MMEKVRSSGHRALRCLRGRVARRVIAVPRPAHTTWRLAALICLANPARKTPAGCLCLAANGLLKSLSSWTIEAKGNYSSSRGRGNERPHILRVGCEQQAVPVTGHVSASFAKRNGISPARASSSGRSPKLSWPSSSSSAICSPTTSLWREGFPDWRRRSWCSRARTRRRRPQSAQRAQHERQRPHLDLKPPDRSPPAAGARAPAAASPMTTGEERPRAAVAAVGRRRWCCAGGGAGWGPAGSPIPSADRLGRVLVCEPLTSWRPPAGGRADDIADRKSLEVPPLAGFARLDQGHGCEAAGDRTVAHDQARVSGLVRAASGEAAALARANTDQAAIAQQIAPQARANCAASRL